MYTDRRTLEAHLGLTVSCWGTRSQDCPSRTNTMCFAHYLVGTNICHPDATLCLISSLIMLAATINIATPPLCNGQGSFARTCTWHEATCISCAPGNSQGPYPCYQHFATLQFNPRAPRRPAQPITCAKYLPQNVPISWRYAKSPIYAVFLAVTGDNIARPPVSGRGHIRHSLHRKRYSVAHWHFSPTCQTNVNMLTHMGLAPNAIFGAPSWCSTHTQSRINTASLVAMSPALCKLLQPTVPNRAELSRS
jgi:hypothetical protein